MNRNPPPDDGQEPLLPHHRDELRQSGLSDATVAAAHAHSLTDPVEIARRLNWRKPAKGLGACLVLPYLDLAGAPNGYATLKPDRPRPGRKAGKPHKYELPKGGGNRTYIPPGVGPLLADPTKPLLITEG